MKVCRGCALLLCCSAMACFTSTVTWIHSGGSAEEPHVRFPLVLQSGNTGADWTICALLVGTCEVLSVGEGFNCPQLGHFWSQYHLFDLLLISISTLIQSTCSPFNSVPIIMPFSHYCCEVQTFIAIPIRSRYSAAPYFISVPHSLSAVLY